jgi:NAD-dependent dihydropyrimidine dehydrogenase PreA subunit
MKINAEKCVMCGFCVPYCPMGCITEGDGAMVIDYEECVECGVCMRNSGCPVDAFEFPDPPMPRYVRKAFSDPLSLHRNTKIQNGGRGTEEIKTNEVTGLVHSLDRVGIAVEMGRPGKGVWLSDVEVITKAISSFGVDYAENNPVTGYIRDKSTGELDPTILNEKILSCIIEFIAPAEKLLDILDAITTAARGLKTVLSLGVICKVDENNSTIVETKVAAAGYDIKRASSKTNVGLGRPRYEDRVKGGKVS